MSTKTIIQILIVCLILAVIGMVVSFLSTGRSSINDLTYLSLSVGQVLGIFLLYRYSTIRGTIFWRIIQVLFGVTFIGMLFKLQHWPGASIMLGGSLIGIALVYSIRFIQKDIKQRLDVFKWLWISSAFLLSYISMEKLLPKEYALISSVFFWLAIVEFIIAFYKKEDSIRKQ